MANDWKRLAGRAARRRAELGLSQIEVAQRGPLSLDRVQAIEGKKSTRYRLSTLLALERALQWREGSIEAILDGGDPTPLSAPAGSGVLSARAELRGSGHANAEQPIERQPGESREEYLDRMYATWKRERDMRTEADRVRARVIESALDGLGESG